jgi:predicted PurR-regulated permease PerM
VSEEPGLPAIDHPSLSFYRVWLPRVAWVTLAALSVIYGTVWVFENTRGFLVTLLISVFVAFALLPAVENLCRRGWRRGAATGVVMAIGAVGAALFTAALLNVAIRQVIDLITQARDYIRSFTQWANETFGLELSADDFINDIRSQQRSLQDLAVNAASGLLGLAASAVALVFQLLTIALFVFYILADLPRLRAAVLRRMPQTQQIHVDTVIGITLEKVGGYVYSRSLLALFSAVFHYTAFRIIGVPYALALAMWVGIVSQFVPTVGTYLAGIFPLLIALAEDPVEAIWVLAAILAYQQIENYVLAPRITANTMDLHPAVAFGAAIVGAGLLGGVGALLALPVAATVVALVQTYADHYDLVTSGHIESPDVYEARMQATATEKAARRAERRARFREWANGISDDEGQSRPKRVK